MKTNSRLLVIVSALFVLISQSTLAQNRAIAPTNIADVSFVKGSQSFDPAFTRHILLYDLDLDGDSIRDDQGAIDQGEGTNGGKNDRF